MGIAMIEVDESQLLEVVEHANAQQNVSRAPDYWAGVEDALQWVATGNEPPVLLMAIRSRTAGRQRQGKR